MSEDHQNTDLSRVSRQIAQEQKPHTHVKLVIVDAGNAYQIQLMKMLIVHVKMEDRDVETSHAVQTLVATMFVVPQE